MAAVMPSKPPGVPTKMKKPSVPPLGQTHGNSAKPSQQPSSSPSSAAKRLPGQTQNSSPTSATPTSANNTSRQNRRLQRITTRTGASDSAGADRKAAKKFPEPWVAKESHILKKFDGRPPSLIVHLYPTNFRFEQQDGSFSYHSEMRIFIEHLWNGTVPHDMVEEFRDAGVSFYDGWLIVKVVDHTNASSNSAAVSGGAEDEKPFSIHNYNPYITPSPHVPYPPKEQTGQKSPPTKQDASKDGQINEKLNGAPETQSTKPQPQVYHKLLRPTQMSRHMDMVLDALAPDPKSLNRKQSQANVNGKAAGSAAPPTPISGVPPTPMTEKGPPLKKQKMKIDNKDLLEYEARVINATAPPLYLEPVANAEEADALLEMLKDPFHDQPPPSPKSRKRTFAELAADDAHAKEQERFMLILDERNAGAANAAAVDGQAGSALFQPRFERFNTLEQLKRDMAEKKQREKDRQLQEDENRRDLQQRQVEEDRRRAAQRAKEQQALRIRQEQHEAHQLALQQQAAQQSRQQAQQQAQAARQQQQQVSSLPPQVQSQMMANQQRSSPVIRQGTPHAASSPVINSAGQGGQTGAGSPPRPGSALQHGHPMARNQSNSGQSRHGTPQMPNATPGMRNATPVLRQGTPAQHMTQASPHGSMMAPTPQMQHAAAMAGGQVPNGMTPQQEMQRRQAHMRMQQMQQQQQMMGGNNPHNMAQQMAQRQAAMHQQNLQQQAQQMGQSPNHQTQQKYQQGLSDQMKAQMQQLQNANHGSPVQNQMNPQQQAAMAQQQQQRMMQQGQMMGNMQGNMQQPQQRMNPAVAQFFQQTLTNYQTRLTAQTASRYGGNPASIPPNEVQKINQMAQQYAQQEVRKRQQQVQQQQQALRQQQAQQQGMSNGMNMMNPNMAAMQQQQQAQHMQGMQLAHAQQMLSQQPNMYQMQMQQQQQRPG
ncbi:uncharacterized protein HMPREF1541_00496 [Cyphellophora europaea CBS 101466]|uniref:Spt20-like SEP domain-containing protein n=1 Tax=Cyphellophora europaea (strain CBS 101466) TaxID=1220924 RepID=W2SC83_CYPE1|nr:uncharacterized protein HMPREF1541_00496 [Cyphellophora europaea CBS 101466]ETN46312.1 hypothetical protein HMPREF1541_00496 [Cyphellophora europaea CBS 101466]